MEEIISKILPIMLEIKNALNTKDINYEEKVGISNFVTSVDNIIEKIIITKLQEFFPDAQIISEESAQNAIMNENSSLKFIIDPIDGTTNFTNGWPHTVAIGIIQDNKLASRNYL